MKIGFFINPLAGYGITSNAKGSDDLIMRDYGESRSVVKGKRFLEGIVKSGIDFFVPSGIMGAETLEEAGISHYEVIYEPAERTSAKDTMRLVERFCEIGVDLIVFVGGDGTARDILSARRCNTPVLGIPAGMKMYSSLFCISVRSGIDLVKQLSDEGINETSMAEVVDIDEEKFRKGELDISLYGEVEVPVTPLVVSESKSEYSNVDVSGVSEYIQEKMKDGVYYIVGPGSTCKSVLPESVGSTNLLGFDIILNRSLIAQDADEKTMLHFLGEGRCVLIISPIGGQNFLLGRGNRQITRRIVQGIGWDNIWVISSQEKLNGIANLYVDIDNSQEVKIPGFIKVLYGYGRFKMIRVKR